MDFIYMAETMVTWKFCQNNPKEIPRPSGLVAWSRIFGDPLFPVARVCEFITGRCGGGAVGQIRTWTTTGTPENMVLEVEEQQESGETNPIAAWTRVDESNRDWSDLYLRQWPRTMEKIAEIISADTDRRGGLSWNLLCFQEVPSSQEQTGRW